MNLAALHPVLKQALGFFETFRKMGFTPDEIFVAYGKLGKQGRVQIVLKAQDKTFVCDAGIIDLGEDDFKTKWKEASAIWNERATGDERKQLWETSYARQNATRLIMAMSTRGFVFNRNLN